MLTAERAPTEMTAAMVHAFGDADQLRLERRPIPHPAPDEVIVAIRAAGINPFDWKARAGRFRWMRLLPKPLVLGMDFAGEVAAVGAAVRDLKPGDRVFGAVRPFGKGTYAEYVAVPRTQVLPMPLGLDWDEAASLPVAGISAQESLFTLGGLQPGQSVLILGASGGVGSLAVQLAKAAGARVVGVCSGRNADFVTRLGCDRVIDYTRTDVLADTERYDLVVDCNGTYWSARRLRKPGGRFVGMTTTWRAVIATLIPLSRSRMLVAMPNRQRLAALAQAIADGHLKPLVGARFPLARIADAHRFSETGRAVGKIVVTMGDDRR